MLRIIPLTSSPALDYLRIQAIMFFPKDTASQESFVRSVGLEALGQMNKPKFNPSSFLDRAARDAITDGGYYAGQMLLFLARLIAHNPKDASIAKAQFIVMRGMPGAPHDRTMKTHWANYQSCSHLHAAWYLAHEVYSKSFSPGDISTFSQSVAWFCDVADHLLRSVIEFNSIRDARQEIGGDWWGFEEERPKPSDFAVPPLTESQKAILSEYRAPTRAK
ncbi:hypothetical protein M2227_002534 [Bradyrhizobium elkanii]|uniref:hypothetical protein n=1 Tax=Bradyrhizobium elkanii TaxID=29448 RepID=UPI00222697B0|nr:hypothetical protein [Bradyrhizobium elkanii]MCW2200444.1 hypothetical protein [Bradyrhizobium elkanii]